MTGGIRAGVQPIGSGDPRLGYFGACHFGATVSDQRRAVHVASELAAIAVGAPFLWWASNQTQNPAARAGLRTLALATLLIDGGLLLSWGLDR